MRPNQTSFLQRLLSNSALVALVLILFAELLNYVAHLLPSALRPAPLWKENSHGIDLDNRREAAARTNRRMVRGDRRRNPGFKPLRLRRFTQQDRRLIARGRRQADWRFS